MSFVSAWHYIIKSLKIKLLGKILIIVLTKAVTFVIMTFACLSEQRKSIDVRGVFAGVAQLVEQLICNQQVGGSSPSTSSIFYFNMGDYPRGQRGQTVNLLSVTTVVRIHHPPPHHEKPCSFINCKVLVIHIFMGAKDMTLYEELTARGLIAQVTNEEEIRDMLNNGKATFYIGFDPTADSLHVGHFMTLSFMKRLQMVGNKPIALVGGGTAMIGDPSAKTDLRDMMTVETIDHNCESFKEQMSKFIDFSEDRALMVNNADWLRRLNYLEFLRDVGPHFSVNRMLTAECYKNRMEKGLTFLEFNYMIMQAYDFYELFLRYGCNMQFGGDDQWSNMLAGTELIRRKLAKDAHALTITLLLTSEGTKMGKTVKGAVWLDPNKTSPFEFYQYWRNVDDADVIKCLKLLTFVPIEEIWEMEKWQGEQLNRAKETLAFSLTELIHGTDIAVQSRDTARELFKSGGAADMPSVELAKIDFADGNVDILLLLQKSGLCQTKSDARRAVDQGGVEVNGEKVTSITMSFTIDECSGEGIVVKKGKKNFRRVCVKQ